LAFSIDYHLEKIGADYVQEDCMARPETVDD